MPKVTPKGIGAFKWRLYKKLNFISGHFIIRLWYIIILSPVSARLIYLANVGCTRCTKERTSYVDDIR